MDYALFKRIETKIHPLSSDVRDLEMSGAETLHRSKIKLLTLNLYLRPAGVKSGESDYKDARLEDFTQFFGDFDIICLQEVFQLLS